MAKLFPVNIDVHVHVTSPDADGSARYSFGLNRVPTEEDMPRIMSEVMEKLPEGFRLMTRHESMMYFLRKEKGYRGPSLALTALEEGEEWHDPETANTMSFSDEIDEDEE